MLWKSTSETASLCSKIVQTYDLQLESLQIDIAHWLIHYTVECCYNECLCCNTGSATKNVCGSAKLLTTLSTHSQHHYSENPYSELASKQSIRSQLLNMLSCTFRENCRFHVNIFPLCLSGLLGSLKCVMHITKWHSYRRISIVLLSLLYRHFTVLTFDCGIWMP